MRNEKHLLHIPNADHPLSFLPANESKGVEIFAASLTAFYDAVVNDRPRPLSVCPYVHTRVCQSLTSNVPGSPISPNTPVL